MAESPYVKEILEELEKNARLVRDEELHKAAREVLGARRVFAAGSGRSGCVARAFCNRLMHLGLTAYFVHDVTTPAIREGDLLFLISGSGASASLISMAEKAKEAGARVAVLTVHPDSPAGMLSDCTAVLPGGTKKDIACDAMVHEMRVTLGISKEEMTARHANLD